MDKWIVPALISLLIISILWPIFLLILAVMMIIYLLILSLFNFRLPPPYLSTTGDGKIILNWYSRLNKGTYLKIIPENKNNGKFLRINPDKKIHNEYTAKYQINSAVISDLTPNMRYYYYIIYNNDNNNNSHKSQKNQQLSEKSSEKRIWGGKGYYFDYPSTELKETKSNLKIISLGDLQPRAEIIPLIQYRIMKQTRKHNPDLFLFLGDHTMEGTKPAAWRQFFHIISILAKNTPTFGVPGNHDTGLKRKEGKRNIKESYLSHVNYPGVKHRYFLKIYGINILAFDFHTGFEPNSKNMELFEKSLPKMGKNEWTIVLWHSSPHNTLKSNENIVNLRNKVIPALEEKGNVLWLGGHEHSYQKFKINSTYYLTSAASSSFHDHRDNSEYLEKLVMKFHYLVLDISEECIKVQAIDILGKIIDDFIINKKNLL